MENKKTLALVESAVMVALATVLSLLKLAELPAGGSVTFASMLPIVLIAYRHGLKYGLLSGTVYGVLQQLLGLRTLSYVTGFASVLAVILLDYVIAFTVLGLGGIFRRTGMRQTMALVAGGTLVCALRYICHVISGATVWAGLSIPTEAALIGSIAYNATYMLPETLILLLVLFYISEALELGARIPRRIAKAGNIGIGSFCALLLGGAFLLSAAIYDVLVIFSAMQSTGELLISGLADAPWGKIAIITGAAIVAFALSVFASYKLDKGKRK